MMLLTMLGKPRDQVNCEKVRASITKGQYTLAPFSRFYESLFPVGNTIALIFVLSLAKRKPNNCTERAC